MFGDVTSANVVGYMGAGNPAEETTKYFVGGSMFLTPGQTTWKVSDLSVPDGNYNNDIIKFFKTDGTAKVDDAKSYYYDQDDHVWYYAYEASGHQYEEISEEDNVIPAGTGFLAWINTPGAKIVYAGEVILGELNEKTGKREIAIEKAFSTTAYQLINNPLPYEVDLTECRCDNNNYNNDIIKFFKVDGTAKVDDAKSYYWDNDDECWYYAYEASGKQYEEVMPGDQKIGAGQGFLAWFNAPGCKFVFPAPAL